MIPGIFKDGEKYGFRANIPGGGGRQVKRRGYLTQDAAYKARIRFLGGAITPAGRQETVAAWFEEFLATKEDECRATTSSGYRYALSLVTPYIGDVVLEELNEAHLREAYKKLVPSYATGTIKTAHLRVRSALRQAVRETRVTRCVAENVNPPKGKKGRPRRTWSFEQLIIFAKHTSTHRDAAMWALFITTGLRRGEVCGLMWPKVDLDEGEAIIDWQRTKTADGRIVEGEVKTEEGEREAPLTPQVVTALRSWKSVQAAARLAKGEAWAGGDYVFTSYRNTPYHPDSLNDRLTFLTEAAGLPPLTPHELRHTYATRALENGSAVEVVSKLLGHTKIETTINLYVHPSNDQGRAVNDSLSDRMFG